MKTLLEVLRLSSEHLENKGVESSRREAEELIADALNLSRVDLYLNFDRPLSEQELSVVREKLARRAKGEPAAYIRGQVDFYHCRIHLSPSVLIPRQETEILVDKIVKELKFISLEGKRLLDLCCGSGCIGLALKREFPDLDVYLSDISKEALDIARKNAAENELDVSLFEGDLFQPFLNEKFDFIICNPPYVTASEYEGLSKEVKDFEPKTALLGGLDGLDIYRRLKDEFSFRLKPGGKAWLEIGASQGAALLDIFSDPIYRKVLLEKDWAGHDRFISLEIE